jgi:hypothetical protein
MTCSVGVRSAERGRPRWPAFTIVELLVVIAIMAILAGLLLPAITRARREAFKAACLSNEKQVGACLAIYCNDHRGLMPSWEEDAFLFGGLPEGDVFDSSLSIALLYPAYADSPALFECPATNHRVSLTTMQALDNEGQPLDLDDDPGTVEYRFETDISATNDPDYLIDPDVGPGSRASRVVYGDGPDLAYLRAVWEASQPGRFNARDYANHEYGVVALFFDGHARFILSAEDGRTPNEGLLDTDSSGFAVTMDTDIYADGNWYGSANWDSDEAADCNLGNVVDVEDDTEDMEWGDGPDEPPYDDWDPVN